MNWHCNILKTEKKPMNENPIITTFLSLLAISSVTEKNNYPIPHEPTQENKITLENLLKELKGE